MVLGTNLSLVSILIELPFVIFDYWTPATLFLPLALNAVGNGLTIPGGMASALSVRPDLAGRVEEARAVGMLGD